MRQFKMKEYAITDAIRFMTWFSPGELLRDRELAAGFINQHFGNLSIVYRYHADVFWGTVFAKRKEDIIVVNGSSYSTLLCGNIGLDRWQRDLVRLKLNEPEQKRRSAQMWELVQKTSLEESDQAVLFCLLTAAYSLADRDLESCPLTAQAAEAAYLRRETEQEPEDAWLRFGSSGAVLLEAREKPYRVLMKQGAHGLLQARESITPRKLVAMPHAQGNNDVPVTLELYASAQDPQPRKVVFYAGDYRYANFVGDIPVWFHAVHQESDVCCMERRGRRITCTDKRRGRALLDVENLRLEIIGFALENSAAGWILLTEMGLDDDRYTLRLNVPVRKKDIVQVEFRGRECLLLDRYGTVYSGLRVVGTGVTALDEF